MANFVTLYHCLTYGRGIEFLVSLFYKKMKIMFNKHLPYITHFIVLHPFLRRPQTLLTAELDKKNLNQAKKKLSSLLNKVQAIPYFQCIQQTALCICIACTFLIVIILIISVCSVCCKLFVIKDFLLTSSKYVQFILSCTLC